jgi:hypothetical protein
LVERYWQRKTKWLGEKLQIIMYSYKFKMSGKITDVIFYEYFFKNSRLRDTSTNKNNRLRDISTNILGYTLRLLVS